MKLIITTAIVLIFTTISCKKDVSKETSNDADSVSAQQKSTMPTNNSSGLTTDSLSTASQNASTQNAPSQDASSTGSSEKKQENSAGTVKDK
ncbi:hypothetical protein OF897_21105 [Chryseobacterium formosus]|uniref:Cytochrome C551 n=1 Tax=Chryseobacterium formosus TaxID=1537363 RepID=A0ABT3XXP8_9FLAO|nr:hypothetical protein [Chryseobacterium formosus]MCX8526420.1 hypothetical protein [Chryseobacterium formosus]